MTDPFSSARLTYRAVDIEADKALFTAINNDRAGYVNSNAGNITLPGPARAERYIKSVVNDALLGAVICLPDTSTPTKSLESKETEEKESSFDPLASPSYGKPIGCIQLSRLSPAMAHHRHTEIGIDILPAYQGQGYGSETILWALDYAFRKAGLHRVSIRAFGWNTGAIRLYERMGFTLEGRERETLWYEGRWWDNVQMGMLEGEWWALEKKRKEGEKGGKEAGMKKEHDVDIKHENEK